jgi:Holliday junction resolvasome RuvABC endonuclease subunit
MITLALDPGGTHCGLAVMNDRTITHVDQLDPKGKEYCDKIRQVVKWLGERLDEHRPDLVVVELPSFYAHSRGNMYSPHMMDSSIKKLYELIMEIQMLLIGRSVKMLCIPPHLVKVNGVSPITENKERTANRVVNLHPEILSFGSLSDHVTDAVALLVWWEHKEREQRILAKLKESHEIL